jgi:YfiH family protein
VFVTDRHGGVSVDPFRSCNLGDHVGDAATAVAENRRRVAAAVGLGDPEGWIWMRQVHGSKVVHAAGPQDSVPEADAAVTAVPGLPLVALGADCAPVALVCDDAVGVVHAGHRGLGAGVVGAAIAALVRIGHGPVRLLLGPCIRPARYEFGSAQLERLAERLGRVVVGRTSEGRPAFDLPAGVREAGRRAGVERFDDVGVCTGSSADHFSYRRDGITGRQAMVVVLGE